MNGMPVPAPKEIKANWSNEKAHLNLSSNLGDKLNVDATVDLKHCVFGAKLGLDAKSFGLNSKELALQHANNGRFAISHCTPYNNPSKLTISGEFDATNMA